MENNLKDYYAIKDAGKLIIKEKDCELHIDMANEVHTISVDKTNIVVVRFLFTNDELEEKLECIKKSEIRIKLLCKSQLGGTHIYKDKLFKNMRFIEKEVKYSSEKPSEFLFVFANKKHSKVKGIVDEYLNRNNMTDCVGNIECELSRVAEELNKIDNNTNELGKAFNILNELRRKNNKKDNIEV